MARTNPQWPHVEPSTVRKQHANAFKAIATEAAKRHDKSVRPFVLYSFRHTFLTQLGQSGCDVWTLARIAGRSSIGIYSTHRYRPFVLILFAFWKNSRGTAILYFLSTPRISWRRRWSTLKGIPATLKCLQSHTHLSSSLPVHTFFSRIDEAEKVVFRNLIFDAEVVKERL
jgi:hypothetical protein